MTVCVVTLPTAEGSIFLCVNISIRLATLQGEKLANPINGGRFLSVMLVAVPAMWLRTLRSTVDGLLEVPVANLSAVTFLSIGASPARVVAPSIEPGTITTLLEWACIMARC